MDSITPLFETISLKFITSESIKQTEASLCKQQVCATVFQTSLVCLWTFRTSRIPMLSMRLRITLFVSLCYFIKWIFNMRKLLFKLSCKNLNLGSYMNNVTRKIIVFFYGIWKNSKSLSKVSDHLTFMWHNK